MAQQFDPPRPPSISTAGNMSAPQKPLDDAVNTAMDKSDVQDLDPTLVAQITQNVINQLRQVNLQSTPSSSQGTSPTIGNKASSSPPGVASTTSNPRSTERESTSTTASDRATASRSPTSSQAEKHTEYANADSPPMKSAPSPKNDKNPLQRPKGPVRLSTSHGESPLEKIWGALFDEEGVPTLRLDRLLRGLALHLVEDYEPKNSLVITPAKMAKYYQECKLEKEYYPWNIIFDDEETYMSRMYRELGCSHHLVQDGVYERPEIPGLTPPGFAKWMTLMLLAHPDEEFERIKMSVVNMPISNPDDRKERYPKDITKRLFPTNSDAKSRNSLRRAIAKHSKSAKIDPPSDEEEAGMRSQSNITDSFSSSPPQHGPQSKSANALPLPPLERERQPYRASTGQAPPLASEKTPTVGPAGESSIVDDDHAIPILPIERERKPYCATPGGGKNTVEPAGSRSHYPIPPAPPAHASSFHGPTGASFPPLRQTTSGPAPAPAQSGLHRSTSERTRTSISGPPGNSTDRGPPPAPSAGTSNAVPIEIHQHPPPPTGRPRNGSFTRRRAPSIGRTYYPTDARPISIGEDPRGPQVTFQPGSYESYRPAYVERAGGHDGYGPYEDDVDRRARTGSINQGMGGFSIPQPDMITSSGRRQSIERRRSPPKASRTGGRDSPTRRSWNGGPGDETYRDAGRY